MAKDINTEKTKKSKKEIPPPVEEPENDIEEVGDDSSDDDEEDDDEDEEGVPLSDIDSDMEDVDIVPYQRKPHKDNHAALTQALSTFALPLSTLPFNAHLSVTAEEAVTVDVNDDLNRELAFYKQALEAATLGRKKLTAEGVPFSRPSDYFAEMVKDDEHMEKIRDRIVTEEATKKASEEAKRQRDLKKFGKQVQVAKIQERDKTKRATLEKIQALKRKERKDGNTLTTEDDIDIELDTAIEGGRGGGRGGKRPKITREKRNEKYGYGGPKGRAKRNDDDVADLSSFDRRGRGARGRGGRGGRGGKKSAGAQRPGKQRRMQQRK